MDEREKAMIKEKLEGILHTICVLQRAQYDPWIPFDDFADIDSALFWRSTHQEDRNMMTANPKITLFPSRPDFLLLEQGSPSVGLARFLITDNSHKQTIHVTTSLHELPGARISRDNARAQYVPGTYFCLLISIPEKTRAGPVLTAEQLHVWATAGLRRLATSKFDSPV